MPGRHVALLRGINVGGKNLLPMKDLAAMFAAAGCEDVETYIQSGNVVFQARPAVLRKVAAAVSAAIQKRFDYRIPLAVRSTEELAAVARDNPYLKAGVDANLLHVAFLVDVPGGDRIATLDPARSAPDAFTVLGREIYLHLPGGAGKSKLTNAYFDGKLGTPSTIRNWRTVLKLLEMSVGTEFTS